MTKPKQYKVHLNHDNVTIQRLGKGSVEIPMQDVQDYFNEDDIHVHNLLAVHANNKTKKANEQLKVVHDLMLD